jgi:hypothetical protein
LLIVLPSFFAFNVKSVINYGTDVPPGDEIIYEIDVDVLSIHSISILPDSPAKEFHVEIIHQNLSAFISRLNVEGNLELRFVSNFSYFLKVSNPNSENLYVEVSIAKTPLIESVGSSYYFDTEENRCWNLRISSDQTKVLPLRDLKAGRYLVEISILENIGYIGLYITDQNPATNPKWYESSSYYSSTTFFSREIIREKNEDWLVVSSQDNKQHDLVIILTYLGREISSFEIAIIVAFFIAGISWIFIRVRNRKRKIKRYFDPDERQKNLQRQIKLVSQIDIRHEGGRYVYMPPDMIEPDLVRPRTDDYEDEN